MKEHWLAFLRSGAHQMDHGNTTEIRSWLERLQAGDRSARDALIQHSCDRLRRLTRKMLKNYPALRRWEQTDDVLQNAMLRLHRSFTDVEPTTVEHFINLAATQIRRELIDLGRHHFGQLGLGANHHSDVPDDEGQRAVDRQTDHDGEPQSLERWTEFHEHVEALPDREREVFSMLWYERLSQVEAATVLNVDVRTIKRHWRSAKMRLYAALDGEPPE